MNHNSLQRQLGATYVEMAISILLFMMIIISVLELLKFSFVTVSVQHTLQKGLEAATKANFSTVGNCIPNDGVVSDALNDELAGNELNRGTCIKNEIVKIAQSFDLTITPSMISVTRPARLGEDDSTLPSGWRCDPTLATSFGPTDAAHRGEIVAICIRTNIPLFSWFSSTPTMDFIVFGRNEIFRYDAELVGGF